ncbi:MAG: type I methionyl aminopeptidase [Patescibacteria group bacterium]
MGSKIIPKNEKEVEKMRRGGRILARVLDEVAKQVVPGVTIKALNRIAETKIYEAGAAPAFLGYKGFPSTLCVSVNEEVVHGNGLRVRELTEGDIVGFDLGLWFEGLCVDVAVTVPVGKVSPLAMKLISVAEEAFHQGVGVIKAGVRVGDIGAVIEQYVTAQGFGVVRDLVGHGVGRALHEPPEVPNFKAPHAGDILPAGATIAIEPMITAGDWRVKTLDDGWTVVTQDRSLSAHYEHTILVTEDGYEILTQT